MRVKWINLRVKWIKIRAKWTKIRVLKTNKNPTIIILTHKNSDSDHQNDFFDQILGFGIVCNIMTSFFPATLTIIIISIPAR